MEQQAFCLCIPVMQLETSQKFNASAARLWPLLFRSRMDDGKPCYLLCGLPKPVECRLEGTEGGVGATRECISDKGTIKQTILEWEPEKKLSFELRETDIYFGPCVQSIRETFEIQSIDTYSSIITRRTDFQLKGPFSFPLHIPMLIGLKSIHYYVFRNWKRLSRVIPEKNSQISE